METTNNLIGNGTIEAHLNMFDMVVFGIMGLSCIVAFFRGFLRELLSLGAWVAAGIITVYSFPHVAVWLKPHVKNELAATGLAAIGTYITVLVGLSIINSLLVRYAKDGADVGMLDNFLGLAFGFLRGGFIISLAFLLILSMMDREHLPDWIAQARTKPFAEAGAKLLATMAPKYVAEMSSFTKQAKENSEPTETPEDPAPLSAEEEGKSGISGYTKSAREQMERLLNSQGNVPETIDNTSDAPAPVHYR